jgi:hypothetical protein
LLLLVSGVVVLSFFALAGVAVQWRWDIWLPTVGSLISQDVVSAGVAEAVLVVSLAVPELAQPVNAAVAMHKLKIEKNNVFVIGANSLIMCLSSSIYLLRILFS